MTDATMTREDLGIVRRIESALDVKMAHGYWWGADRLDAIELETRIDRAIAPFCLWSTERGRQYDDAARAVVDSIFASAAR